MYVSEIINDALKVEIEIDVEGLRDEAISLLLL